jgi:aryl-alcohol dehydrogenase-like predicted oxidoreductase
MMKRIKFGPSDLMVSPIGLGCMSMSGCYGQQDDDECIATIHEALEHGVNFLDTSSNYGKGHNHTLLGKALKGRRDQVVIHSKLGSIKVDGQTVAGTRDHIRTSTEGGLKRLGTDHMDVICISRVDPVVPIEDSVAAMAELVKEGKTRYIGISKDLTPELLDRAWSVHPIVSVQDEYSLFVRDPEEALLDAVQRHGMGFMAFAPLGRGMLGGLFHSLKELPADDDRRKDQRYMPGNFEHNVALVEQLEDMAAEKHVPVSTLVLAWLMHQPGTVVPIPSSKSRAHLRENIKAASLSLSREDVARIDRICPSGAVAGLSHHSQPAAAARMV